MKFSAQEVMQYVAEENVQSIRLAFCDIFGTQKNIYIHPDELERAFTYGIGIDASALAGFGDEARSDVFLHPDASTLAQMPWRPDSGSVARMFCDITYPDGSPFAFDGRALLKKAVAEAEQTGVSFAFGAEMEFYLFKTDENGEPTKEPCDMAGYMDIAPDDKGEKIRREICLTLEKLGIMPESSHHEEGPGQNEIDFRYSDPLSAADNAITFRSVVKTVAMRNGLAADFSPKPLPGFTGNGMHINMSASGREGEDLLPYLIAGIMDKISEMTLFLNPSSNSYLRLGRNKAPGYVTWSRENRSQLIRIPAEEAARRRVEVRSADPTANPYLAFALLIHAGLHGIVNRLQPQPSVDLNLYTVTAEDLEAYRRLPSSLKEAQAQAACSEFLRQHLPAAVLEVYLDTKL